MPTQKLQKLYLNNTKGNVGFAHCESNDSQLVTLKMIISHFLNINTICNHFKYLTTDIFITPVVTQPGGMLTWNISFAFPFFPLSVWPFPSHVKVAHVFFFLVGGSHSRETSAFSRNAFLESLKNMLLSESAKSAVTQFKWGKYCAIALPQPFSTRDHVHIYSVVTIKTETTKDAQLPKCCPTSTFGR